MRAELLLLLLTMPFATASAQGPELFTWQDSIRNRPIPVAIYQPVGEVASLPIVVFSHGYNENMPGAYLAYAYLMEALSSAGYFVVSIQHELSTDDLLDLKGTPRVARMPNWERGAANIHFVLSELQRSHPELDHGHITLVGHSNGGDMSVLYSHQYPDRIQKVITLDHRRMPILRASQPRSSTLRSSDQLADEDVLPTEAEAEQYGIRVVYLEDTPHNNMDSDADPRQRSEITALVIELLNDQPIRNVPLPSDEH